MSMVLLSGAVVAVAIFSTVGAAGSLVDAEALGDGCAAAWGEA